MPRSRLADLPGVRIDSAVDISKSSTAQRPDASARAEKAETARAGEPRSLRGEALSEQERREVEKLRKRDQEVRTHEQAHVAAAGPLYRGGPYYTFRAGPDGKRYAVGGSVKIDTSEGSTPEETIQKAARIRAAALAPADPSSTDQAVAAKASRMEAQARQELAREKAETQTEANDRTESPDAPGATDAESSAPSPDAPIDAKQRDAARAYDAPAALGGGLDVAA